MTDLKKEDSDKIRGLVVGSLRGRVVCRAVAKRCGEHCLERTAPVQFALQTKAGPDALVHVLRFPSDNYCGRIIVSLDGPGAFGQARRVAFLEKLRACPEPRRFLSLVAAL